MASRDGWSALFSTAFKQSRNAMVLLDARRHHVDANGAYLGDIDRRDDVDQEELLADFLCAAWPSSWTQDQ